MVLEQPFVDALGMEDVVALQTPDHAVGFENLQTDDAICDVVSPEHAGPDRKGAEPMD